MRQIRHDEVSMNGTTGQEVYLKTSGKILWNSYRLGSCLWIGRLAPTEPNVIFAEDDPRHPFTGPFQLGEFCLMHPYHGRACNCVTLRGIFLPLSTCKNHRLRRKFEELWERYTAHPFTGIYPNLDEVLGMRDDLRAIGPLDLSAHFRRAGEAYFPFTCTEATYAWLVRHFEMMVAIHDNPDRAVQLQATTPLPWPSLQAFTNWLFNANWQLSEPVIQTLVLAAFIYPNSDSCDWCSIEA